VAVLREPMFANYLGGGSMFVFMLINVAVAAVAWIVTALLQPLAADNRPRRAENLA